MGMNLFMKYGSNISYKDISDDKMEVQIKS